MQPTFWLERWQQGQIGFDQAQVNADLLHYWPLLACPPGSVVFVPLCGKSRDMCWLHAQGYQVLGVDLAELAVQSFYTELQLQPQRLRIGTLDCWHSGGYKLYVGDFFDLTTAQLSAVDAVYDRAALIALPPPLRVAYQRHLSAILPVSCKILLLTMDYPQEQMPGPPFSVSETEVRELFAANYSVALLATRDTLAAEPRLRQRGLQQLHEQAYLLQRRP